MVSDLSNIIKEELANTLEQLLSKKFLVNEVTKANKDNISSAQSIEVSIKFTFSSKESMWKFYVPTSAATNFEYLMLGGMGDLKEHIDDEIADAINEIISNVSGSIATSVNAQGFPDISSLKSEVLSSSIVDIDSINFDSETYEFLLSMDDESTSVLINFDDSILPFIPGITGKEVAAPEETIITPQVEAIDLSSEAGSVASLLSETSAKNLKLLFDIKLRLSVRLGKKIFLLKNYTGKLFSLIYQRSFSRHSIN